MYQKSVLSFHQVCERLLSSCSMLNKTGLKMRSKKWGILDQFRHWVMNRRGRSSCRSDLRLTLHLKQHCVLVDEDYWNVSSTYRYSGFQPLVGNVLLWLFAKSCEGGLLGQLEAAVSAHQPGKFPNPHVKNLANEWMKTAVV